MNTVARTIRRISETLCRTTPSSDAPNTGLKVYSNLSQLRSDSDDGNYVAAIIDALENQDAFDNFKRCKRYNEVLEHVSEEHGKYYIDILSARDEHFLRSALETVLLSDNVGNPVKFNYKGFSAPLSPTTLRYVKVASDLKTLFGDNLGDVAEIGCGYGGQALVNDQLLHVRQARLFDLPYVNMLIDRYLNYHLLRGSYLTTVINREPPQPYDLAISNYAFSELPKVVQRAYVEKVLSRASRGYLTMNSGLGGERSKGKLTLDELCSHLPAIEVLEEEPLTSPHNYIIVWGHDRRAANAIFTKKAITT